MNNGQEQYFRNVNRNQRRFFSNDTALKSYEISNDFTTADLVDKAILSYLDSFPIGTRKSRVREDAKTFLYVNTEHIIYGPLSFEVNPLQLRRDIFSDLKAILLDANLTASQSRSYEISSHEILKAIVRNWEKLITLRADSW